MSLLNSLMERSRVDRLVTLERLEENGDQIKGDFQGSVTGTWVKFDETGAGIVSFRKKEYVTKPIGFTSLPAGSEVELSHANGIYYSKF